MNQPPEPLFDMDKLMARILQVLGAPGHRKCGMLARQLRTYFCGPRPWPPSLSTELDVALAALRELSLIEPFTVSNKEQEFRGATSIGYKLTYDGWVMAIGEEKAQRGEHEKFDRQEQARQEQREKPGHSEAGEGDHRGYAKAVRGSSDARNAS